MRVFGLCAAVSLLVVYVYLLATQPLPLENLPSNSLTDLSNEMRKGSMKFDIAVKKEPETSWSLPARVHFIWIGAKVIKDKYVKNINNFCKHNPDYQVWKSKRFKPLFCCR